MDVGALLPRSRRPLRLLDHGPTRPGGRPGYWSSADRRDERDEALRELLAQLLAAGLGALVVAAVVGERLAKAALAPVERYRTQAASIAARRQRRTAGRAGGPRRRGHPPRAHPQRRARRPGARASTRERQFTQDASHELRTPLTLLSDAGPAGAAPPAHRGRARGDAARARPRRRGAGRPRRAAAARSAPMPGGPPVAGRAATWPRSSPPSRTTTAAAAAPSRRRARRAPGAGAGVLPVAMPEAQVRQVLANLLGNAAPARRPAASGSRVRRAGSDGRAHGHRRRPGCRPGVPADRRRPLRPVRHRPRHGPAPAWGWRWSARSSTRAAASCGCAPEGTHHRYADRHPVPCAHPGTGTTATSCSARRLAAFIRPSCRAA